MPTANEVLERFNRAFNSLCSIQIGGNPAGTGFLVGPSAVLTNYHVVENVLTPDGDFTASVQCVFDYLKLPTEAVQLGTGFAVEKCLDWSRYGSAETTRTIHDPMPTLDELDYALLALAQPVGEQPVPDRPMQRRGWINVWDTPWDRSPPAGGANPFVKGSQVIVIQHPLGAPQIFASRQFIAENILGNRMQYEYMTAPGSSGSPCLDVEFKLFALHHLGDSRWDAQWNLVQNSQGVPIRLIRDRIARHHVALIPKFEVSVDARSRAPWSALFSLLREYPDAKKAIDDSREIVKGIADRIADLRLYKIVHDVLMVLQLNLSRLQEALNEADPKKSRDSVRLTAETMLQSWVSHEDQIAQAKSAGGSGMRHDMKWVDELSSAMAALVKADDAAAQLKANIVITKHIRFRPADLNTLILMTLKSLPVDALLSVFSSIENSMKLGDIGASLNAGPQMLRSLWARLQSDVADHDAWQDIDNDLMMLEEQISFANAMEKNIFKAGWSATWPKVAGLCEARPEDLWSRQLSEYGRSIDADLVAGAWDRVHGNFPTFRSWMSTRFGQVDKSLMSASEQIIRLGNPLSVLVEGSL